MVRSASAACASRLMETVEVSMTCAFCAVNLGPHSLAQRQAHYETHLQEDTRIQARAEQPRRTPKAGPPKRRTFKNLDMKQFRFVPETDEYWDTGHHTTPPNNFTPGPSFATQIFSPFTSNTGLITFLRHHLLKSNAKGVTSRAVLCHESTTHISKQPWDVGWGCGYRNFLVACTALTRQSSQLQYRSMLENPLPPSVRNLQAWIEAAWSDGFDPEAAADLGKIAGSRRWIGTSDLWVAYTYIGIPAQLMDFDFKKQPDGSKSKPLTDWVVRYFRGEAQTSANINNVLHGANPVSVTDQMPLILQRKGHSQAIVGYELERDGTVNLLIFDSSYRVGAKIRKAAMEMTTATGSPVQEETSSSTERNALQQINILRGPLNKEKELQPSEVLKHFRLRPKQLEKYTQYQLLVFPLSRPWTEAEKLQRKTVASTRVC
ncbi:hypothetical protein BDN72DRAFT_882779 [Pluteus cervinus]|uniref:Uncharacterized protein n=1 Tax=Pluteus cervinus TaxID=181527 RepID=A0ACD3AA45_9AGAR|nr:hypothetical protein BDN72DRAFT_882779 [Pluteus cervinus]